MDDILVLVADEQRLMAEALAQALGDLPSIEVVGVHFKVGWEAVRAVIEDEPHVVVYDFWMPCVSGTAAARYLSSWAPASRVLLMSWLHGPLQVKQAAAAGALGLVRKNVTLAELAETIRRSAFGHPPAVGGNVPAPATASGGHLPERCWERLRLLTPRELDVLHLLARGRGVREAATDLGITEGTTRNHIQRILRKTKLGTLLDAVELARHEGLVLEPGAAPLD